MLTPPYDQEDNFNHDDEKNPREALVEKKEFFVGKISNTLETETPVTSNIKKIRYHCPHCNSSYSRRRDLKYHAKKHHAELFENIDFNECDFKDPSETFVSKISNDSQTSKRFPSVKVKSFLLILYSSNQRGSLHTLTVEPFFCWLFNLVLLGDPEVTENLYCYFAYLYWEGCVIYSIYLR